jgi:hypothetical protein
VATKEVQLRMLKTMGPIWEATSGHKTIVVGPMVRYLTESCCTDEDHLPNRNDAGFGDGLRKKMLEARNVLKDFLAKEGHSHCRVLDPAVDIAGKPLADIWNVGDPTHPREEVYDSMVAAFVKAENRIDLTAKRPGEKLSGPVTKKAADGRTDCDTTAAATATGRGWRQRRRRWRPGERAWRARRRPG